jgi:Fic family protein
MKVSKKDIVLRVLKESPEGLTIQEIADKGKMSRITATIYIHELLGEGVLTERKIGAYRMFYVKEKFLENVSSMEVLEKLKEKMK